MIPMPEYKSRMRERPDSRRSMVILGVVAVCGLTLIGQVFWLAKNQYRFAPFAIERIRCETCAGVGMVSRVDADGVTRLHLCPACYGLGSHQIRRVDDNDQLCPACVGFGRVEENGQWRWCRRCDGRGLIRRDDAPPPVYQPPIPRYGTQELQRVLHRAGEGIASEGVPPAEPEER